MPSFQSGLAPYSMSDYSSRYSSVNHNWSQDHQNAFPPYGNGASHDLGHCAEPYDQYKFGGQYAPTYNQPTNYGAASMTLPPPIGAPMLPSLRIDERYAMEQAQYHHRQQQNDATYQDQQSKGDKAVGGVSAKLDYEMEQMTDFVTEMTVGIIKPGVPVSPQFRKWVLQVLNATRLPSATILLSLSYLTLRIRALAAKGSLWPLHDDLSRLLTVAMILGSKFLDDNTFQNKSWAEVSAIPVVQLNRDEREWLVAFDHRLHHDSDCADGFNSWEKQWKAYKTRIVPALVAPRSLDTSVRRQQSLRQAMSYQQPSSRGSEFVDGHYNAPGYSPYGSWYNSRSGSDASPSTASHTGPNTPDYYGTHGGWGPMDAYPARQQFPSLQAFNPGAAPYYAGFQTPNFANAGNGTWNCHGAACQCSQCRQAHFFQPRYGPIVVG